MSSPNFQNCEFYCFGLFFLKYLFFLPLLNEGIESEDPKVLSICKILWL